MSLDTNGNTLAEFNIKSPEPNITNLESVLDLFIQAISKKLSQWQEIVQFTFIKVAPIESTDLDEKRTRWEELIGNPSISGY
jgi:hypothetical protein